MTKSKRFKYWVDSDGEDFIDDNYHQFRQVDLCMPCGKQVCDMLNELEKEKEYWRDKALHKELDFRMSEKYKVTVNDLYVELKKLIENGDGDKEIKLSVNWDNVDHLHDLRAYSTDFSESYLLLMGYD